MPRVPLEVPLAVPVHIRSELGFHRGLARNISEDGMLVELEETPPIGSRVEVTIMHDYSLTSATSVNVSV
ncbi:MAG: PilZ domain-containing protein, partial [Myxococcota bacterium]